MFKDYEDARDYSLTVPWKIATCSSGESCWCRIILPIEDIGWTETEVHPGNNHQLEAKHNLDAIIPDGSLDRITAEYIIKIHNESL